MMKPKLKFAPFVMDACPTAGFTSCKGLQEVDVAIVYKSYKNWTYLAYITESIRRYLDTNLYFITKSCTRNDISVGGEDSTSDQVSPT